MVRQFYSRDGAKFWLSLQDDLNLEEVRNQKEQEFNNIKPIERNAAKLLTQEYIEPLGSTSAGMVEICILILQA